MHYIYQHAGISTKKPSQKFNPSTISIANHRYTRHITTCISTSDMSSKKLPAVDSDWLQLSHFIPADAREPCMPLRSQAVVSMAFFTRYHHNIPQSTDKIHRCVAVTVSMETRNEKDRAERVYQRTYKACIPCRRRKAKCELGTGPDGLPHGPPCLRCRREQRDCQFSAKRAWARSEEKRKRGETDSVLVLFIHPKGEN